MGVAIFDMHISLCLKDVNVRFSFEAGVLLMLSHQSASSLTCNPGSVPDDCSILISVQN